MEDKTFYQKEDRVYGGKKGQKGEKEGKKESVGIEKKLYFRNFHNGGASLKKKLRPREKAEKE